MIGDNKGHSIYAINGININFAGNVAGGKAIHISDPTDRIKNNPSIPIDNFAAEMAIDYIGNMMNTFWMASQLTDDAHFEVHLKDTFGLIVGGLEMTWRYAPEIMYIERWDHDIGQKKWIMVPDGMKNYTDPDWLAAHPGERKQATRVHMSYHREGFTLSTNM